MNGVGRIDPFFSIFTTPLFSVIRALPSGRNAKFVGKFRPDATVSDENPVGKTTFGSTTGVAAARSTVPLAEAEVTLMASSGADANCFGDNGISFDGFPEQPT